MKRADLRCSVFKHSADDDIESSFFPIPDLARTDADVTVLALLNNVAYSREVNGTIFQAQNSAIGSILYPVIAWLPDRYVSFLGCSEQYQLCSKGSCTKPGGLYQMFSPNATNSLKLNDVQAATVEKLWGTMFVSQMYYEYFLLDSAMLLARDRIVSAAQSMIFENRTFPSNQLYYSSPLSDNQWQQEVEQIQNTALAILQQLLLTYGAQPTYIIRPGVNSTDYVIPPSTEAGKKLCSQQKYRSLSHSSFSIFGIAFILLTGSIIIGLSYAIPSITSQSQLRSNRRSALYRREEWMQDNILQLLRVALMEQCGGTWVGKDAPVPVTLEFARKMQWDILDKRKEADIESDTVSIGKDTTSSMDHRTFYLD
jgi:hypothetical protein